MINIYNINNKERERERENSTVRLKIKTILSNSINQSINQSKLERIEKHYSLLANLHDKEVQWDYKGVIPLWELLKMEQ